MANGSIAPVIAGLAVGVAAVVLFSTWEHQVPQLLPVTDYGENKPPRVEYHFTNSGLIVLDTHRIEDNDYNKRVIDIILRNTATVELLEGEHMVVFGIGETNCSFGSCTIIRLDSYHDKLKVVHIFIDYANNKVVNYY